MASNAASFTTHDLGTTSTAVAHFAPTASVQIDRIDGDFYDIKALQQINDLSDNDTIVQATWSSYYAVDSGHNSQINLLSLDRACRYYDLIVVQGSWHNSNMILQQNVLLNDDIVKMYTARGRYRLPIDHDRRQHAAEQRVDRSLWQPVLQHAVAEHPA